VITAYDLGPKAKHALRWRRKRKGHDGANKFPPGWDEARVRRVLEHYDSLTDEEVLAEDEAAFDTASDTTMTVPTDLVPAVRELISKHRRSA
jgi:hypothetical protein